MRDVVKPRKLLKYVLMNGIDEVKIVKVRNYIRLIIV